MIKLSIHIKNNFIQNIKFAPPISHGADVINICFTKNATLEI